MNIKLLKNKIRSKIDKIIIYIKKHHRWIFGILFTSLLAPLILFNFNQPQKTKVYHYVPDFQIDKNINELKQAECWVNSLSTGRSDAFRCSTGNGIYDPCFLSPIENFIKCPSNPSDKNLEYFKFNKAENFMDSKIKDHSIPWFIKLNDNSECLAMTGASIIVADKRFDYSCSGGKSSSLQLPLEKDGDKIFISCFKNNRLEKCFIREAWY